MDPTARYQFPKICLLVVVALGATRLRAAPPAPLTAPVAATGAELYLKPPEFTSPAISADGKNVGFIAQSGGHTCLFRLDLTTGQIAGIFSAGEGDVASFWWIGNQRVLVSAWGKDGREYFSQDLTNSPPHKISSLFGCSPEWIRILPNDPDHVLALFFWQEAYLARIDLNTGRSSKIESFISIFENTVISANGELRAKIWLFGGKWRVASRSSAERPWHIAESSSDAMPRFAPVGMAADDRHILVYAHDQGNTEALMLLDPDTDQRTLLGQRPNHDTYSLVEMPPQQGAAGVAFYNYGPEDVTYFDKAAADFSAILDRSLPGMNHRVTSSSADGSKRIVTAWVPGYPPKFFLFDAGQQRLSLLGDERPDLTPGSLGTVRYFTFKTRDGLEESGYMLMPRSATDSKPVPLIVLALASVGERAPSASNYNAQNQYFASRGYAVAHIAVRGTAGFGTSFLQAGDYQLTGKIVEDLEDGVAHLAREGLIDSRRVALIGVGRGGMFALRTAAFSKSFRAVVTRDAQWGETATSVGWMTSSRADIPEIVKQAGGTQAAYNRVRQFAPDTFIGNLSIPALLIYPNSDLRESFNRHQKACEVYDPKNPEDTTATGLQVRLLTKIADFLDKTLK